MSALAGRMRGDGTWRVLLDGERVATIARRTRVVTPGHGKREVFVGVAGDAPAAQVEHSADALRYAAHAALPGGVSAVHRQADVEAVLARFTVEAVTS